MNPRAPSKPWTEAEVELLKQSKNDQTYKQLSETIGRTLDAVIAKCKQLGIRKGNPNLRSENDCRFIYRSYREMGLAETAKYHGLSKEQVAGVVTREKQKDKKIAAGVKTLSAEKLRAKAIRHAWDHGFGNHSEDFASYCVLRLYEGRNSELKFMFIDYKRETFGSARSEKGRAEMKGHFTSVEVGESDDDTYRVDPVDEDLNPKLLETLDMIGLKGTERVVFFLHTLFGLRLKEIGLCLNVTDSRVSQILQSAEEKIQKRNAHNK